MNNSIAYNEFLESLEIVKALIKLDTYKEPPPKKDRNYVYGLRGGSIVLIVASFNEFLNNLSNVYLSVIKKYKSIIDFSKLPPDLIITNVNKTLKQFKMKKNINNLTNIKNSCRSIINDEINPAIFKLQSSNPNPIHIINLFKEIGFKDIFKHITKRFQRRWKKIVSTNIIKELLSGIIDKRNNVAHKVSMASQITKIDLNDAINYLQILAWLLDSTYRKQINSICILAKIP